MTSVFENALYTYLCNSGDWFYDRLFNFFVSAEIIDADDVEAAINNQSRLDLAITGINRIDNINRPQLIEIIKAYDAMGRFGLETTIQSIIGPTEFVAMKHKSLNTKILCTIYQYSCNS